MVQGINLALQLHIKYFEINLVVYQTVILCTVSTHFLIHVFEFQAGNATR